MIKRRKSEKTINQIKKIKPKQRIKSLFRLVGEVESFPATAD